MIKEKLVFVHGWGLNSAIWQPVIEQLNQHFECISLDLPGYGTRAEEPSPDSIEMLAESILERAPDTAHWCAWSLGGMAALQAAHKAPERFQSLSLICTTPKFMYGDDWPIGMASETFQNFADELGRDYHSGIKKFLLLQSGAGTMARTAAKKAAELLEIFPAPNKDTLAVGLHILRDTDMRPLLKQIRVRCQVISGHRDRVVHPEASTILAEQLPNAELLSINSGHAPHLSQTSDFCLLIKTHIEQLEAVN